MTRNLLILSTKNYYYLKQYYFDLLFAQIYPFISFLKTGNSNRQETTFPKGLLETGTIPSNVLGSPSRKLFVFIWSRKTRSSLVLAMSIILCPVCLPAVSSPCLKTSKDEIPLDNSISLFGSVSNVINPLV